jgi:isopentenyl diphosphate isomerase/L-lactate dehydrogenase-like FMN-dependent dehydrogenase
MALTPEQAPAIEDLHRIYRARVPKMFYDYCETGSYTTGTFVDNTQAFAKYKLRQRVARNVDNRTVKTTMVGEEVAMPVALAPVGLTGMQHADGEILACRAAQAFGVPYTLTTMSISSMEDVAKHNAKPFWFQLYVMRDRGFSSDLVARAKAANCSALVLTLDLQLLGQRHKDIKNGLAAPPKLTFTNILNMMTKPRWCMAMLGTKRRHFGNIVGHVKGVTDMGSLADWTHRQFDPTLDWSSVDFIRDQCHCRVQPWRPPVGWCAGDDRHAGAYRRCGGRSRRGVLRFRDPHRHGHHESHGHGRQGHHGGPRLCLWAGRCGRGGGHARTGDSAERARRDAGPLRRA